MQNTTTQNSKLPFSCSILCVSLASLAIVVLILTPVLSLYRMGYISTEVTVWVATGIFVVAAIFGSYMLFLITRYERDACHDDDSTSKAYEPGPGHI